MGPADHRCCHAILGMETGGMAETDGKEGVKASGGISILAIIILSLMAAGSGGGFGFIVPALFKAGATPQKDVAHDDTDYSVSTSTRLKPLVSITTNLAQPKSTWIRLEAVIVMTESLGSNSDVIAKQMSEDIIGYLRTISLDQLDGPSGFQHLREDLNDRVRVRSEGKVAELIITSLIVE